MKPLFSPFGFRGQSEEFPGRLINKEADLHPRVSSIKDGEWKACDPRSRFYLLYDAWGVLYAYSSLPLYLFMKERKYGNLSTRSRRKRSPAPRARGKSQGLSFTGGHSDSCIGIESLGSVSFPANKKFIEILYNFFFSSTTSPSEPANPRFIHYSF